MNKKRFIKIISVFLLVSFICFSSFQIKKTYTKAIGPLAIPLAYGVELLFNIAATAFISNAVYEMGTEARKIYDDWQNKKDDDEKKAQYGYWGEKLKNSMTSEEVENALNSAVNVVDGAVGLTLSSKSYQEFIENVNKDRERNLSITFKKESDYSSKYSLLESHAKKRCCEADTFLKNFNDSSYPYNIVVYANDMSVFGLSNQEYGFLLICSSSPVCIKSNNNFSTSGIFFVTAAFGYNDGHFGGFYSFSRDFGNDLSYPIVATDFKTDVDIGSKTTEFEITQPDLEIKANPDYDSEISVSIPTTEIDANQLTESPYKENASNFEYPDSFENVVNNTTINNEYNKNPIKEGNEGLLDYGDTVNLDFSPLYGAVEDKFPFCVPFDLFHAIDTLTAEKEKPEFTITFPSVAGSKPTSFIFNFDDYEFVIEIFRYFVLFAFCIGLVINTKKILGGS